MLLIKRRKKWSLSMNPCGAPYCMFKSEEFKLLIFIYCFLFLQVISKPFMRKMRNAIMINIVSKGVYYAKKEYIMLKRSILC